MYKKFIVLVVVVFGLMTFFLPLVRIQAPLVGTQRISGWDVVKPGQEKKRRSDLGLGDTLDKLEGDFLRQQRREAPLAVKQAQALAVTLPLAYLALVLGGIFAVLHKPALSGAEGSRPLTPLCGAVGLLASVYSLVSVYWLNSGVKEMLLGGLRKSVAEQVEVSSEAGLYLLAAALAALLLASFLPLGENPRVEPAGPAKRA